MYYALLPIPTENHLPEEYKHYLEEDLQYPLWVVDPQDVLLPKEITPTKSKNKIDFTYDVHGRIFIDSIHPYEWDNKYWVDEDMFA